MAEVEMKNPFSRDVAQRIRPKTELKHVQKARIKHRPRAPPPPAAAAAAADSPFLTRFFALPPELRLEIYRLLLVQPRKWDLCHTGICAVGTRRDSDSRDEFFGRLRPWFRCAHCRYRPSFWRSQSELLTSDTPARSQWARPKENPYLCDECYPMIRLSLGLERAPTLDSGVPCLCARRQNLGVLLINRRIYAEASPVFWAENCFAFETAHLLADFLAAIGPEKCARIRSISLFAPRDNGLDTLNLVKCWPLLRQCTALQELDLEASVLDERRFVLEPRTVTARRVRFVQRASDPEYDRAWRERRLVPRATYGVAYTDPLVELLSASMAGKVVDKEALQRVFEEHQRRMQLAGNQSAT